MNESAAKVLRALKPTAGSKVRIRTSDEDLIEAIRAYRRGVPVLEIANALGIGRTNLYARAGAWALKRAPLLKVTVGLLLLASLGLSACGGGAMAPTSPVVPLVAPSGSEAPSLAGPSAAAICFIYLEVVAAPPSLPGCWLHATPTSCPTNEKPEWAGGGPDGTGLYYAKAYPPVAASGSYGASYFYTGTAKGSFRVGAALRSGVANALDLVMAGGGCMEAPTTPRG